MISRGFLLYFFSCLGDLLANCPSVAQIYHKASFAAKVSRIGYMFSSQAIFQAVVDDSQNAS